MYNQMYECHKMVHEAKMAQEMAGAAARRELREARRAERQAAKESWRSGRERHGWAISRLLAQMATAVSH